MEHSDLTINDGNISDESITSIDLLDRASEQGYARQNNLVPNNWIDIHLMTQTFRPLLDKSPILIMI